MHDLRQNSIGDPAVMHHLPSRRTHQQTMLHASQPEIIRELRKTVRLL